jgi:hypothetical protein
MEDGLLLAAVRTWQQMRGRFVYQDRSGVVFSIVYCGFAQHLAAEGSCRRWPRLTLQNLRFSAPVSLAPSTRTRTVLVHILNFLDVLCSADW